uniref:(northern house mosquito) hypothetical protein n=1 Tax=Culex pipiens TaxID=7175 RepID=A0A8D8NJ26_CULPI
MSGVPHDRRWRAAQLPEQVDASVRRHRCRSVYDLLRELRSDVARGLLAESSRGSVGAVPRGLAEPISRRNGTDCVSQQAGHFGAENSRRKNDRKVLPGV